MKKFINSLIILITFSFQTLTAETRDSDMIAEGHYTLERCTVLRCTESTAMLDDADFPVRMKGSVVAVLDFNEDSRPFLVILSGNEVSDEWVEENLKLLLHDEWTVKRDISCYTRNGEPYLYWYALLSKDGMSHFELFDPWFASRRGEILFDISF